VREALVRQTRSRRRFLALALGLHVLPVGALLYLGRQTPAPLPQPLPVLVSLIPEAPPAPVVQAPEPPAPAPPTPSAPTKPRAAPAPSRTLVPTTPEPAPQAPANDRPSPALASPSVPSPAPAPVSTPATEQSGPISSPRFDAAYLQNPKPLYPLLARRRGIEGKVILQVRVGPEGDALSVQLHQSSGDDSLDKAALETVRRWRFVPARQGNTPVPATVLVPITFKLEN